MQEFDHSRRDFLRTLGLSAFGMSLPQILSCKGTSNTMKPNIIIIFCDDLGYGDLGSYGHPTIRTPNLDTICNSGQKWTNFYAAASVCTPSRAGLLTGRLPIRNGMCSDVRRVLFPYSAGGLPEEEITIAEAVKTQDYATACIGKWHLGHLPRYLPTRHGFDYYFGIPYSNDMDNVSHLPGREAFRNPKKEYWNVPLMRNEEIIERPADQTTITKRYTQEAVEFIKKTKDKPFFLYLAHTMVHVPLFVSKDFQDKSIRGLYGDAVEEIDWGVGEILKTLDEEGKSSNTLLVFTSDNGPWLSYNEQGGSAGLLKEGKGMTWEGGMREPTIFYWPGRIKPDVIMDIGSTLDLFSTVCHLTGAKVPTDRIMDSENLLPVLLNRESSSRQTMFFYRGTQLYAVRKGSYKAHFITEFAYRADNEKQYHDPPLLYHLDHDPSEKYDISQDHPEIIADILKEVKRHRSNLVIGEDQLAKRIK